jgi:hypothetical protein
MFSDDGMGLPLAGFEVVISSDDLQVLQTTSLWMIPHTNLKKSYKYHIIVYYILQGLKHLGASTCNLFSL